MVEVVAPLYKQIWHMEIVSKGSNMDLYWSNSTHLTRVDLQHQMKGKTQQFWPVNFKRVFWANESEFSKKKTWVLFNTSPIRFSLRNFLKLVSIWEIFEVICSIILQIRWIYGFSICHLMHNQQGGQNELFFRKFVARSLWTNLGSYFILKSFKTYFILFSNWFVEISCP